MSQLSPSSPRRRTERAVSLTSGQPLATFAARRSCSLPGCAAQLSRYNPNDTCAAHGGWREANLTSRRRR